MVTHVALLKHYVPTLTFGSALNTEGLSQPNRRLFCEREKSNQKKVAPPAFIQPKRTIEASSLLAPLIQG